MYTNIKAKAIARQYPELGIFRISVFVGVACCILHLQNHQQKKAWVRISKIVFPKWLTVGRSPGLHCLHAIPTAAKNT
ncbi:MAG: hypothetical protein IPO46_08140 [Chitinophagaceae bacterium]|jgi:hypothetical protein|nr:hypothetical protein [Chitinophagaceae bacterium]MBK7088684.1 hypothetical protein [Chitinophagaceae bacterium]MBK7345740.1 hypothetical protein [Chitinophagaceae bacterium]MBK8929898.1 hypothetical protein [Chitinophagaceae bacterium]QQS62101.1 MAG: hypothetical protein IPO46_08140 [Chitinophagaceae bacterium]